MKCKICNIGTMYPNRVRMVVSREFTADITFRNVPALVCQNCGEEFIPPGTMDKFLEVTGQADDARLGLRRIRRTLTKKERKTRIAKT